MAPASPPLRGVGTAADPRWPEPPWGRGRNFDGGLPLGPNISLESNSAAPLNRRPPSLGLNRVLCLPE